MTFRIQAGGIYKLPFPFTTLSGKKARPVLTVNSGASANLVAFTP